MIINLLRKQHQSLRVCHTNCASVTFTLCLLPGHIVLPHMGWYSLFSH